MRKRLKLSIPSKRIDEPIIFKIVTTYNLKPNILEAQLEPEQSGHVMLELDGNPVDVERGILYLKELDILVEDLD